MVLFAFGFSMVEKMYSASMFQKQTISDDEENKLVEIEKLRVEKFGIPRKSSSPQ